MEISIHLNDTVNDCSVQGPHERGNWHGMEEIHDFLFRRHGADYGIGPGRTDTEGHVYVNGRLHYHFFLTGQFARFHMNAQDIA
jgi:hypothetical protein